MFSETCRECTAIVEEDTGRWLILDQSKKEGFEWMFLCIECVRDWRKRGLEREGLADQEVLLQVDKEYPAGKGSSQRLTDQIDVFISQVIDKTQILSIIRANVKTFYHIYITEILNKDLDKVIEETIRYNNIYISITCYYCGGVAQVVRAAES